MLGTWSTPAIPGDADAIPLAGVLDPAEAALPARLPLRQTMLGMTQLVRRMGQPALECMARGEAMTTLRLTANTR